MRYPFDITRKRLSLNFIATVATCPVRSSSNKSTSLPLWEKFTLRSPHVACRRNSKAINNSRGLLASTGSVLQFTFIRSAQVAGKT